MSVPVILFRQIIVMFILVGIGFLLRKAGKITDEGSKTLGNILIYISLPSIILNGFMVERTPERMQGLLISALVGAAALAISMVLSHLVFRKDAVAEFASSFSNPGLFGTPLIIASLSEGAIFYIACFIAYLNLMQFTWGVSLMTGDKKSIQPKKILTAPAMIAIIIGLFCFFTALPVPTIIRTTLNFTSALNTPLAMFTIGVYLSHTTAKEIFTRKSLYLISLMRLVVIPLITLAVLCLIPSSNLEMKTAILIAAAAPVGSNVAVYAQLHGADYKYSVGSVVITTLLSLATIPLIVRLAEMLW